VYSSPSIKKYEMDEAYSTHGEERNTFRILLGTPEGKRPLGRSRRRLECNTKIGLRHCEAVRTRLS
jgi:hypothetical protein